jgi:hypothetical protein
LIGQGPATLIISDGTQGIQFIMGGESELGHFSYGEEGTARTSGEPVIGDAGVGVSKLDIHDIYVHDLGGNTAGFINYGDSSGEGRIWNIHVVNGQGFFAKVNGLWHVFSNFMDGFFDDGVIVENGSVYIYDNDFIGQTNAIVNNNNVNDLMIGLNRYESVTNPFVDNAISITKNRFLATRTATWNVVGALVAATTGVQRLYFPENAYIQSVQIAADTPGTGTGTNTIDIHKDGVTIFTTQGNRPTLAAAANLSALAGPDVRTIAAGSYLTVDVDAVTATTPAEDVTIFVRFAELPIL